MIVRGTTENRDELTGNFGSALEDTSIGDYRLIALFAEKTLNAIFGVLQHYRGKTGSHRRRAKPTRLTHLGHQVLNAGGCSAPRHPFDRATVRC